ncbi:FMN reductase (NADH) NtaB [compost metagenome]
MQNAESTTDRRFRQCMSRYATGVSVLACGDTETPAAMTANSLTSVSLDPPLILFCVRNEGRFLDEVLTHPDFSVNVLSANQIEVSQRYAGRGDGLPTPQWSDLHGVPVLQDSQASLVCRLHEHYLAGDHTIVIGRVLHTVQATDVDAALVFLGGRYHRLAPQSTQESPQPCA